jgi:hypothetical protein
MKSGEWLLACALMSSACKANEYCLELCNTLKECGMLPSPLGATEWGGEDTMSYAHADCVSRCDHSFKAPLRLSFCDQSLGGVAEYYFAGQLDDTSNRDGDWCRIEADGPYTHFKREIPPTGALPDELAAPDSVCDQMALCITAAIGEFALGKASFELVPVTGQSAVLAQDLSCETRPPSLLEDAGFETFSELAASAVCRALGTSSGSQFYERNGVKVETEPFTCVHALSTPGLGPDVPPGPLIAGLRLFERAADGTFSRCAVFYSRRTVMSAGVDTWLVPVGVPNENFDDVIPCEGDRATCSDGVDNDQDGFVDCDDLDCSTLSQEQPELGICTSAPICLAGSETDAGPDAPGND